MNWQKISKSSASLYRSWLNVDGVQEMLSHCLLKWATSQSQCAAELPVSHKESFLVCHPDSVLTSPADHAVLIFPLCDYCFHSRQRKIARCQQMDEHHNPIVRCTDSLAKQPLEAVRKPRVAQSGFFQKRCRKMPHTSLSAFCLNMV